MNDNIKTNLISVIQVGVITSINVIWLKFNGFYGAKGNKKTSAVCHHGL